MSDPPPPPLGPGPEFDVIRRILENPTAPGAGVALGPGDDCALIQTGDGYLAVAGVLYGGFKLRVRQIAERNRVLEGEVAKRTSELRESNEPTPNPSQRRERREQE